MYIFKSCKATTNIDIINNFKESKESEESVFNNIIILDNIAENYRTAKKIITDYPKENGLVIGVLYYPDDFKQKIFRSEKRLVKKKINILKKIEYIKNKRLVRINNLLKNINSKPKNYTRCTSCKSKILNYFIEKHIDENNKCPICQNQFLKTTVVDRHLFKFKQKYSNTIDVYEALWGGNISD